MEKKKINLISFLLLCIVVIAFGNAVVVGIRSGISSTENNSDLEQCDSKRIPVKVRLKTANGGEYLSTFNNNGKVIPYSIDTITTYVENNDWKYVVIVPSLLLLAFCFLLIAIYKFICFIRDITKGNIFIKQNYKRLKWVSWAMALLFLYDTVKAYMEYNVIENIVSIPNYQLESLKLHWNVLWVALVFALFAQVFALGIKMKEEQELTI